MAVPRFGQERIKDIPPLNLLDALYAQGLSKDYLRRLVGMSTPEITSYLLNDNQDRDTIDRAVRMAQGEELGKLEKTTDEYERLRTALEMRGVAISGYKGAKDVQALASWANTHVNPQALGNAIATALPGYRTLGGYGLTDEDRQSVTLYSNPQTTPTGVSPAVTGQQGVRGQTAPNTADIAAVGGNVAAATPPAGVNKPAPTTTPSGGAGAGAGDGGGANNQPPPPSTWNDDQIRDFIKANFGSNAYFIDIPDVWEALKSVVKSGKGANGLMPALEGTDFWKQSKVAVRSWYVKERADPAQAAADVAQQAQAIQALADQAGITIDPDRVQAMAQSYMRYGWTNTDLQRAIAAEWHYDPTSKNQAAAVSKMKQDARNWLVPLSDQAIQTWGQGLIAGTTTDANWQQYLRDNAKSLFPQLTSMIDAHAGDPNFTIDTFVNPYKQQAASLLGVNTDEIDMSDPKWRRALDVVDPKTNTRRIMSLDEWQSTLKTDQQYGYDKTKNGINEALNLATNLKTALGF